jgi:hypothetical protein
MTELLVPKRNIHIPKPHDYHHYFKFQHCCGDKPVWESDWVPNQLVDGGEQSMLDVFYRAGTAPTFHFSLWNDTPVDTDTIATLVSEVTGTGYARISVARNSTDFPTLALDAGDYRVTSIQKTFTAGGAWTAATALALISPLTGTAGTFYAWAPLSQTRTLATSDTLNVTMAIKLA